MNPAIAGLIRHALTTLGGVLVTNGWLSDGELQASIGAVVTVVGVVWSIYEKRTTKVVVVPEAEVVVKEDNAK